MHPDHDDTFTLGNIEIADIPSIDISTIPSLTDDTIIFSNSLYGNMSTITLSASNGTTWNTGSYTYNSPVWPSPAAGAIKVQGDADIEGNLTVKGVDVVSILSTIQQRLAILVPDPKLLEKYAALQEAYDHYKTLEALCIEQTIPPETK